MTVPAAKKPTTYHHLLAAGGGEIHVNKLFYSEAELRKYFVTRMQDGSLDLGVDHEEIEATIIEAEQEAGAADYMEGVNPPAVGDPENCIDALMDLLGTHGIDVHINQIHEPTPQERP